MFLTDKCGDDIMHALQEAGQVLGGGVVGGGDLSHDRCCLRPRRLHAALLRQDVGQTQDSIHLHTHTNTYTPLILLSSTLSRVCPYLLCLLACISFSPCCSHVFIFLVFMVELYSNSKLLRFELLILGFPLFPEPEPYEQKF